MSNPIVVNPDMWSINHTPAASAQATISKGAVPGIRHFCTSICAALAAAAAQTIIQVNLRDGASGAGTILWSQSILVPIGGYVDIQISGLNIPGTAGNAMTLEFSGAPVATNVESVALTGYDTV